MAAEPAACAASRRECGGGCAQTVHQARYEHAHGSRLGKPAEDRVLPDVKATRRNAAGEASTSGRDAPADQARCGPSNTAFPLKYSDVEPYADGPCGPCPMQWMSLLA